MTPDCQFREVQKWSRLVSWPVVVVGWSSVAVFATSQGDSSVQYIALALAIVCIPLTCLLLEWMGPTVEVRDGLLSYSIWPFYRREFDLSEVSSCMAKTFHPPGNDVQWKRAAYRTVPDTHYVELRLRDGRVIDITTLHPERMVEAIRRARALEHHEGRTNRAVTQ